MFIKRLEKPILLRFINQTHKLIYSGELEILSPVCFQKQIVPFFFVKGIGTVATAPLHCLGPGAW